MASHMNAARPGRIFHLALYSSCRFFFGQIRDKDLCPGWASSGLLEFFPVSDPRSDEHSHGDPLFEGFQLGDTVLATDTDDVVTSIQRVLNHISPQLARRTNNTDFHWSFFLPVYCFYSCDAPARDLLVCSVKIDS